MNLVFVTNAIWKLKVHENLVSSDKTVCAACGNEFTTLMNIEMHSG